jgi:FkbH-like protein
MPSCYSTCAFYTPRQDLKCRRFDQGAQTVRAADDGRTLGFRVSFRKWGKLESASRPSALSPPRASVLRNMDAALARLLAATPLPHRIHEGLSIAWNRAKTRLASKGAGATAFDAFLIECFSQTKRDCVFTLSVKPAVSTGRYFQRHFTLKPGYNRIEIALADIEAAVALDAELLVQVEPVDAPPENAFIFTCLEFVVFTDEHKQQAAASAPGAGAKAATSTEPSRPASKVKCVVWDLDNTLWRGTLIEDGVENLTLNEAAVQVIKTLDERGILHSIASKNNPEDAAAALERFGLSDYFLAPQIGWGPKSASIDEIARRLNIHKNTFLFIDDQQFERAEVLSAHPVVRVIEETRIGELLDLPELDAPVTEEGRNRRVMYKVEAVREAAFQEVGATFLDFLRSCSIELIISEVTTANVARVFELSQRTNQLNYAGKATSRSDVEDLLSHSMRGKAGFVLSCSDKFGDYGVIGFAIVDLERFHVENLFMSCRVQHKKVDHAFFAWLIERAMARGRDKVSTTFRFSGRNQSAKQVLEEMKFSPSAEADIYVSPQLRDLPERDVVKVIDRTPSAHGESSARAMAS